VLNPTNGGSVVGSVLGSGFRVGDTVIIDASLIAPTVFGNQGWITFEITKESLRDQDSFMLEVFRPQTMEKSNAYHVHIKQ